MVRRQDGKYILYQCIINTQYVSFFFVSKHQYFFKTKLERPKENTIRDKIDCRCASYKWDLQNLLNQTQFIFLENYFKTNFKICAQPRSPPFFALWSSFDAHLQIVSMVDRGTQPLTQHAVMRFPMVFFRIHFFLQGFVQQHLFYAQRHQ